MAWIESCKDGIVLQLHCQPGAKVTRVVGEHDGRLKIALHAPAVDNRANEALVRWLAGRALLTEETCRVQSITVH